MISETTYGESYETLRDSVENSEARAAWRDHDRRQANLVETYRSLKDDSRYTEEHKASEMWAAFERESGLIKAAGERARVLLVQDAKGRETMAMPRPKGENVTNLSVERLLASQNEAVRIVRKTQRLQSAPGPFKQNTADVLKEEYAHGMEAGGAEGVAICKGALMAAGELGISEDEFLNGLRTPEQLEELDKARRYRRMAQSIGKSILEPPLTHPATGGASLSTGPGKLFIPRNRPAHTVNPISHWIRCR
jgi:hypothetical protein